MPKKKYAYETPATYFMTVEPEHPDHITVNKRHNGKDVKTWRCKDGPALVQWLDEENINDDSIVMCSPTLDFPQGYTKNQNIINLANKLREL